MDEAKIGEYLSEKVIEYYNQNDLYKIELIKAKKCLIHLINSVEKNWYKPYVIDSNERVALNEIKEFKELLDLDLENKNDTALFILKHLYLNANTFDYKFEYNCDGNYLRLFESFILDNYSDILLIESIKNDDDEDDGYGQKAYGFIEYFDKKEILDDILIKLNNKNLILFKDYYYENFIVKEDGEKIIKRSKSKHNKKRSKSSSKKSVRNKKMKRSKSKHNKKRSKSSSKKKV